MGSEIIRKKKEYFTSVFRNCVMIVHSIQAIFLWPTTKNSSIWIHIKKKLQPSPRENSKNRYR